MINDKTIAANDELLRKGTLAILQSGTGYGVEFACLVWVYPLEDGRFAVVEDESPVGDWRKSKEKIFKTPEKAVDYFMKLRHKKGHECGLDLEVLSRKEKANAMRKTSKVQSNAPSKS